MVCRYSLLERAIAEKVVLLDIFSAHTSKDVRNIPYVTCSEENFSSLLGGVHSSLTVCAEVH